MWNEKKKSGNSNNIDQVLDNSLSKLVASRPSMESSPRTNREYVLSGNNSSSSIPPVKPAAAAMPLYPGIPDSDDDSGEFDFKKIASNHNFDDDDRKMAAAPSAPSNGSFNNNNYKSVPMAPGIYDDDYEDRLQKKMAASNPPAASLKKPPPSYATDISPSAAPRKLTPEEKIQEKIQLENAMRASARETSNSFLTRPDRMEDKMLIDKKKSGYHNTGTSTPGAQSVAPTPKPTAQVEAVQTAQPQEQHDQARKEHQKEENQSLMTYGIAGAVLVVVVVLIVVLAVVLTSGDDGGSSTADTEAPAQSNQGPQRTPEQDYLLSMLPETSHAAIDDQPSPQAWAFEWLAENPSLQIYSKESLTQRFALATLYFALNGDSWRNEGELWLEEDVHECNWYSRMVGPCDVGVDLDSTDYVALKHLALSDNGLSGTLPMEISYLTGLETIDLVENNLQGSIPSELGVLKQVTKLDMSGNALIGRIPGVLGQMASLTQLFLEQNQLTGNVPSALAIAPLQYLRLISNNLSGRVPEDICSIRSLSFDCSETLCGCDCRC